MKDVLETYQRPRDPDRPLVCLDESSKQLIVETRAPIPARPGRAVRHDYEYERNGVARAAGVFRGYYDDYGYGYLPLYVFCGRHLLAAKLRPSNIDASGLVAQIRTGWPRPPRTISESRCAVERGMTRGVGIPDRGEHLYPGWHDR